MKKLLFLFSLIIGLVFVSGANAQTPTPISYKVGTEKVMTITVKAGKSNKYAVTVKKGQVINVSTSGNIGLSKTNNWSVVNPSIDYKEGVDRTQDGEAYFSLVAGRNGKYIITVSNGANNVRTFKLNVEVSNDIADFEGGEEVK